MTSVGTAASGDSRTPVSTPASSSATVSVVEHLHTGVGTQAGDVPAAVVEGEPEPAGQRGQRGLGLNGRVQVGHPRPHVRKAAGAPRQR